MRLYIKKLWSSILGESLKDSLMILKDGTYRLEITRDYKARSIPQNNLLHAWLMQLERESHIWYTMEEWKKLFKSSFLSQKIQNPMDRRKNIFTTKDTRDLTTVEFNNFLYKIQEAARSNNIWPITLRFPSDFIFDS